MFDFYFFYAASIAIAHGQNPYDQALLSELLKQLGAPHLDHQFSLGFPYPPYTFWAFAPLFLMSFAHAQIAWVIASVLCVIITIYALQQISLTVINQPLSFIDSAVATLFFFPFVRALSLGQTSFIPLVGVSLFYLFYCRKKYFIAGLWISIALFKPHLLLVWLFGIAVHSIQKRKSSLFYGLTAGVLLQLALSFLLAPNAWTHFTVFKQHLEYASHLIPHATFNRIWEVCTGTSLPWTFLTAMIGAVCVGTDVVRSGWSVKKSLLIYLPFSFVVAPFGWAHDQVILLPTYLFLLAIMGTKLPQSLRLLLPVLFLAICSLLFYPRFEFFMWIIPVTLQVFGHLSGKVDSKI